MRLIPLDHMYQNHQAPWAEWEVQGSLQAKLGPKTVLDPAHKAKGLVWGGDCMHCVPQNSPMHQMQCAPQTSPAHQMQRMPQTSPIWACSTHQTGSTGNIAGQTTRLRRPDPAHGPYLRYCCPRQKADLKHWLTPDGLEYVGIHLWTHLFGFVDFISVLFSIYYWSTILGLCWKKRNKTWIAALLRRSIEHLEEDYQWLNHPQPSTLNDSEVFLPSGCGIWGPLLPFTDHGCEPSDHLLPPLPFPDTSQPPVLLPLWWPQQLPLCPRLHPAHKELRGPDPAWGPGQV